MARRRDRVIAIILTVVFFVTSFGLSFVVIWQLYKDNKQAKTVNGGIVDQKNQQDTQNDQVPPAPKPGSLEGTPLPDFTPIAKIDSVQTTDLQVGEGQAVVVTDLVTVDYTGAVAATGTIFQSSLDRGQPVTLSMGGVIKGWQEGIVGMQVGGKRRLLIPAAKAYGENPPPGIPKNADLVFDVTLHGIGEPKS